MPPSALAEIAAYAKALHAELVEELSELATETAALASAAVPDGLASASVQGDSATSTATTSGAPATDTGGYTTDGAGPAAPTAFANPYTGVTAPTSTAGAWPQMTSGAYVGNSDQVRGAIYMPNLSIDDAGDVVTATPGAIDIPEVTIIGQPVASPTPAAQPFQLAPLTPDETQALNSAIQQAVGPPPQVSSPSPISSTYAPASQGPPLTDPSGLTAPAAPGAPAAPDWTTQLAFTFTPADPRLIQPFTPVDTANSYLNAVVNSFFLSWGNVFKAIDNVPYSVFLGLGDLAQRYQEQLQPINDMGPLAAPMGLVMEVGPALEASQAWLSTNQTVRGIATAPAFWAMGAGSLGGGVGQLPMAAPRVASELAPLAQELEFVLADLANITFHPVTDPDDLEVLQDGLELFKKLEAEYRGEPNGWNKAASEAGSYVHQRLGAAGPGEGVDFVDLELKTHWTPWVTKLTLMSGVQQSLAAAEALGEAPVAILHFVIDVSTGQFAMFSVQP